MADLTLTADQCLSKIVSFVRDNYTADPSVEIPLDQSLLEVGILDSYAVVELMAYLEKEFKIKIPDEDVTKENMGSVHKMTSYVMKHAGMARQA